MMLKVLVVLLVCVASAVATAHEYGAPMYDAPDVAPLEHEMAPAHQMGYSLPMPDDGEAMNNEEESSEAAPAASSFLEQASESESESESEVEESRPRRGAGRRGGRRGAGRRRGAAASPRHNLLRNRKYDIAPGYHTSARHLKKQQPITGGNPVGTHPRGTPFRCVGGGCERAVGGRLRPKTGTKKNPAYKVDKLSVAFQAVKEEIMNRALELRNERKWSKAVKSLLRNYRTKVSKVSNHVKELKREAKNLLRKKKQIQNAQIQKKLTSKLRLAQADMALLQKQLTHITNKESEFAATESNLRETMRQLKLHLRKLKGAKPPTLKHKPYKV